jgi:exosortase D (VPLPA-CTERM-specific)
MRVNLERIATAPCVSRWDDLSREVYCVLGIPVDAIDMPAVLDAIEDAAADGVPFLISTPNLNYLVNSKLDPEFHESLMLSELCPPDGMGVVWIAWLLGIPIKCRVAGSDIFEALKSSDSCAHHLKLFLLGGAEGVVEKACATLNERCSGLSCVGSINPGFTPIETAREDQIIDEINASQADFLLVALGAKNGQLWLQRHSDRLQVPIRAHLGATINFLAENVKRAPLAFQKLGFEWLWRIKEEPYLWKRYFGDAAITLQLLLTCVLPLALLKGSERFARRREAELVVDRKQDNNSITLSVCGAATAENLDKAVSSFRDALAAKNNIVIDLSNTRTIDARFLGLLLMVRKSAKKQSVDAKFVGASSRLQKIFQLNGLEFLLASDRPKQIASVQPSPASWGHSIGTAVLVATALVVTIGAFGDGLLELVKRWSGEEEYTHGFLIPLVSVWLLWNRRGALLASGGRPHWSGLVVILAAVFMQMIGEYTSIFILSHFAFIFVLMGIALVLGGYPLLKLTFIPIAFLIFAIPLPYFIQSSLTLQLQLISSQLGVDFIRMFQIPVYLEGNTIDFGYYQLQVVDACSGLRYLYPLLSLSFLAAYLFQAPIWQRAIVFLSAIPITIGMNGLRIGLVGVTVDHWGMQMANGLLHFFEGWVIFIACAGLLVAEVLLLTRLSGKAFFQNFHLPVVTARSSDQRSLSPTSRAALMTSILLIGAAGLTVHAIAHQVEFIPERTRFAAFPDEIGQWRGHPALLDQATEKALGLDDYILSDYRKPDGESVNLYVAYYSSQRNGYSPHSPLVCMPGGGWLITRLQQLNSSNQGTNFPFNRVIIERDGSRELVYYWFDERGRKVANEYWAKWYLLVDAITKDRTDGSLIRLITQIPADETEHQADARLNSFMHDVLPSLGRFLPSEKQRMPITSAPFSAGNTYHG